MIMEAVGDLFFFFFFEVSILFFSVFIGCKRGTLEAIRTTVNHKQLLKLPSSLSTPQSLLLVKANVECAMASMNRPLRSIPPMASSGEGKRLDVIKQPLHPCKRAAHCFLILPPSSLA